ncbi:MAG: thioredoxin domain-containing protein [Chloroflexaceae bacterium]|nr:thioredoxin domain-containing protein [Chloroflexaceae bacterium]NJO07559.1 thioredoxin domain-containing protein [Chloroflexaceae bacterium]
MEVEPELIEQYIRPGRAALVYRHLAQLGESSLVTAEASECAADQDRFWEMRDIIYRNQSAMLRSGDVRGFVSTAAAQLGLDQPAFELCMDTHTHHAFIEADYEDARNSGVRSRPVFDIVGPGEGQRLVGALPFAQFEEALNAALAE